VIPRSLRGRLIASYVALSVVLLIAVGGTLFVVLRGLHTDAASGSLADVAGSVLPQVRQSVGTGNLRGTLEDVGTQLASRDIQVMLVGTDGRLRPIGGQPVGEPVMQTDGVAGDTIRGSVVLNGTAYLYAATVIRRTAAAAPRAVAFLTEDRSGALALADLVRAIPAVALVILLVAAPLAWLVARSVTRPLERVASAASGLPIGSSMDLPLEGPSEVRALTGTFNAMSDELADTRRRESELLADLRHDLRTPLTVISGFAAALVDGTASGDDVGRAGRAIGEEADRLELLVGELGTMDGLRSGENTLRPEQIDAGELLATTRERFLTRAEAAGVDIQVSSQTAAGPTGPAALTERDEPTWAAGQTEHTGPTRTTFAADRLATERILANLVANALDLVPRGGHVWLSADRITPDKIALTVTDDGPGFPPGASSRVFERFYRADPSRSGPGSGLGLAIVRELAQAHGGSAHAENIAPHGARVGVILPIVPQPA
jgi:signal transduction histidine kinase